MSRGVFSTANYIQTSGLESGSPYPLTIAGWVYMTATSGGTYPMVFGQYNQGGSTGQLNRNNLYYEPASHGWRASSRSAITGSQYAAKYWNTPDVWFHLCGVWANNSWRQVYINGASGTLSTAGLNQTPLNMIRVGCGTQNDSGAPLYPATYCRVDDLAFWGTNLSQTEIIMLAHRVSPLTIRPASLLHYWDLTRGDGSDNHQDLVNKYTLTKVGTVPTWTGHQRYSPAKIG